MKFAVTLLLLIAFSCFTPVARAETSTPLVITVKDQVLHPLNPRLFGQFMERPAFSGEIGPEAAVISGTSQLQPEAEKLIREMKIPVLRFPGGTDVDFLDWTDMIDHAPGRSGDARPVSTPRGNKVTNRFGYDEFLRLCERNGSEAILVVNFRDGLLGVKPLEEAVAHAAALVAYCNAPLDAGLPVSLTQWPQLRAKNGHPDSYRVKYIQIGNETWMFNPAVEKKFPADPLGRWHECLRAYIKAILAVDPSVKIIVDATPAPVTAKIHAEFKEAIHGYAVHAYKPWGIREVKKGNQPVPVAKLSAEEIWNSWVAVPAMDEHGQSVLDDESFSQARKLGYKISMTEWNWNGWWAEHQEQAALDSLFAKGLGAASYLHAIMRRGDLINLACQSMLVGQHWPINAIRIDPENRQPAYQFPSGMVTEMYSQNHGDEMLAVDLVNEEFYQQPYQMGQLAAPGKVAYVDVIATKSADALTVHMINRRFTGPQTVSIDAAAFNLKPQAVELTILEGRLNDQPRAGEPLCPARLRHETVAFTNNPLKLELPPRTVVFARFALASANKKGAAGQGNETALKASGVSWTYNWKPAPVAAIPSGVEFVPMIWGKRDLPAIGQVKGKVLLGFNEPDREKQAHLTVEEALELWPQLAATQMWLGSPAPAGGGARPGGWLDRFMTGAKEKGLRVDFICLHWYGENYDPDAATKSLKAHLTAVHERYQKPVWLTEFALSNHGKGAPATVAEQQAFMAKALPMLDALPFVERYGWFVFGAKKKEKPEQWFLLAPDGGLSDLGKTYSTVSPAKP